MPIEINHEINKGLELHKADKLDEAQGIYLEVLKQDSDNINVLYLLGFLKIQKNLFQEAVFYLEKTVKLSPDFFDAWFNLGLAYKNNKEFDKAIEAYKRALEIEKDNSKAYFNLANIYERQGDTFSALDNYENAYKYNRDESDSDIPYFLGLTYLKVKDFENGIKLHESRPSKPLAILSQTCEYKEQMEKAQLWDGTLMKDKTLFAYYESALGDTLMYVRYLALVKDMFKKVIFKPQLCFIDFFKENNFGVEIIDNKILPQDVNFDVHIPIMSIPYVLNLNTENIPLSEGYLKADLRKVKSYREKYFNNNKLKIGIKWKGNLENDLSRVIPLSAFYKLFELPQTQFYSLQKGAGIEDFKEIPENFSVINLGETFNDFTDTAAAIENCDLIICNDTSVAHLAGAMGKACWILLPYVQNWRWHTDISYSPWYKSVKLFKQNKSGDWNEVFERVYKEIIKLFY